ncbi:hypothetical protein EIP91_011254, partial [Steccherinum ochraceum]
MSFQDIETGLTQRPLSPRQGAPPTQEESTFLALQSSLSMQVFKINSNVQGILKLVDQLGTGKDTSYVRKSLHDLTEVTRDLAKRGTDDLKKLAALQTTLPRYKTSVQKTSHDFQVSLVAFQRAQQVSAERQRTVVEGVKIAIEEESAPEEQPSTSSPSQRQAQLLQNQLSPQELAHQESLIQEREVEIREIETGIHELSEIFRDLGTLVQEQGGMLDNIESNISSIAVDTAGAAEELTTAHEYQRRAGRRALCLMLVLVVVVAVVLLACTANMANDVLPLPTDLAQTRVTVYMGFVSFMILVWDHIITLGDEVEYIWMGRKGPIVWLFFINRYLSPFGFIINLFAYMSPSWTPERYITA